MGPLLAALLVLVDPGHDPSSPGATSARGRPEFELNEEVAELVGAALAKVKGLAVERTRRRDESLSPRDRGLRANERHAALLLSVHHDAVKDEEETPWEVDGVARRHSEVARGFSLHVRGDVPAAVAVARALGRALVSAGFVPTTYHRAQFPVIAGELGIYDRRHLAMLNAAQVPAVLLECGFIIHRDEELELRRPERRALLAAAVAGALGQLAALVAAPATPMPGAHSTAKVPLVTP